MARTSPSRRGVPVTANITDTYSYLPGSLTVNKVIAGPAAGSQGAVTIHAVCDGTALTPDFTIAAGRPAASYSYTWTRDRGELQLRGDRDR